jgi:hypothetical protein
MPETIENIKIPYPTEGVIRSSQLSDTICPENSVQLAINMNFDRIGSTTIRLGIATYATTLAGSIKAFGTLNSQASATKYLFAHVGATIQALNSGTGNWAQVRASLTGTAKARFSQFLNRTWMVNGNAGDDPKTSNGGTFDTTDVPATLPAGDFIEAGFDGRVWIGDAALDILYYTDIVQSTDGTSYVTPLTFSLTENFIAKFSPQDGESMTGLFRVPKALLIFKQNHIYRVYAVDNVDPYPAYNVGTYSQESIVQGKDGIYFHHSSGFYKFTYDAQPTEISRRVNDFVKAIPRANYEDITGVYDGTDAIKWSVGPVTVEGVTYSNCQMRYSLSTQIWTIYDFADTSITALISYDNGTTIEQVAGTSTGLVGKLDSGNTDFDEPIYYELIDRWRSFTEMYSHTKTASGVAVMSENGGGSLVQYQTDKEQVNKWHDIGTLKSSYAGLLPNIKTKDFNLIRFRIRGNSTGTPIVLNGIEILKLEDAGFEEN